MEPKTSHLKRTTVRRNKGRREWVLWCDEGAQKGKHYSHFYGGVLVKGEDLAEVQTVLNHLCKQLHLYDEIKWQKVSSHYLHKYEEAIDVFFGLVQEDKIKLRIVFTENGKSVSLSNHKSEVYFDLYYQFISRAFDFEYGGNNEKEIFLRIYLDYLPFNMQSRKAFKKNIIELEKDSMFHLAHMRIRKRDVQEVDSKKHLLLQFLDVVIGAVSFGLNNKSVDTAKAQLSRYVVSKIGQEVL